MQLTFLVILVALFLILVFLTFYKDSVPMAVFALVVSLIIGATILTSQVEIKTGTNSTLTDDNRTIILKDTFEPIRPLYSTVLALTFFMMAIWLLTAVVFRHKD